MLIWLVQFVHVDLNKMFVSKLLLWFQCVLSMRHAVGAKYTKEEYIATAKEMLKKFDKMPVVPYGEVCANVDNGSIFHKYVTGIESTLEKLNYDETESMVALEKGYNFHYLWSTSAGWNCDPKMLKCNPPNPLPPPSPTQAVWYQCGCAPARGHNTTQDHPSAYDPSTKKCKFTNPTSICSENRIGIMCKEADHVCLIKDVHIKCTHENVGRLMDYLKENSLLPRLPNDCKCTPKSLEQRNFTGHQDFITKEYVTAGKRKRGPGEKCANVDLVISQEIAKYPGVYIIPHSAKAGFQNIKNDPDVVECDETKQLSCATQPGAIYGICDCPLVDYRTGWQNHPEYKVTTNGNCALAPNSDCGTIKEFGSFDCYQPDECLIMAFNVRCTPENWVHVKTGNKWSLLSKKKMDSSNSSERYLKRCHCYSVTGEEKIYENFDHWKQHISTGVGLYYSSWIWLLGVIGVLKDF